MAQKLILDVNENPKKVRNWILFAFQHIFAMLVACITVAYVTDLPVGPTLIAAGVGTLIYIFCTKGKSPVFLASSFAYISAMSAALNLGVTDSTGDQRNYLALIIGMILVGLIYVIVALINKFCGSKWMNKLLPPVVIGPVIMVIGLGLASSAVGNILSNTDAGGNVVWTDPKTFVMLFLALFAMIVTSISAHYGKKIISLIPFVIGMGGAYVLALILTGIGIGTNVEWLQVVDFTPFKTLVDENLWVTTDFLFMRAATENVPFEPIHLLSVFFIFAPVSLVTICEHIGDHKNVGNIIGRDLLNDEPGITRTLIGDGIATAVSGVICGAANTTYGENVAVIGVTKVASVGVIFLACIITIVCGFIGPLAAVLETMPSFITGGVSLILYGFIASSGVKMLINEHVNFEINKNIIVASVILVSGIGGLSLQFVLSDSATATITSTALSMILGVVLNLILKDKKYDHELSEEEIDKMIEEQRNNL